MRAGKNDFDEVYVYAAVFMVWLLARLWVAKRQPNKKAPAV
jgi:hypothetical protein